MNIEYVLQSGKINMIIDGQYGSTGKGLIASYIAYNNHIDLAIGRLSPNAGHTFYLSDLQPCVTKMLPISGIVNDKCTIYLSAGSVIDVDVLKSEIEKFDIDINRLVIHPRAAIVTLENKLEEADKSGIVKIASTQSGSGSARASKLMRKNPLAQNEPFLKQFVKELDLDDYLKADCNILVETGQGFDLGLNFGFQYPNCTSIDVIPSAVLSDIGCHPKDLGNVIMSMRTFPIRVGNITSDTGEVVGYSGDVYADSEELSWSDLGVEAELTTVTRRIRRVFTFSIEQYKRALKYIRPDFVFLNFINYLRETDIGLFREVVKIRKPDFVGYGATHLEVCDYDKFVMDNVIQKY